MAVYRDMTAQIKAFHGLQDRGLAQPPKIIIAERPGGYLAQRVLTNGQEVAESLNLRGFDAQVSGSGVLLHAAAACVCRQDSEGSTISQNPCTPQQGLICDCQQTRCCRGLSHAGRHGTQGHTPHNSSALLGTSGSLLPTELSPGLPAPLRLQLVRLPATCGSVLLQADRMRACVLKHLLNQGFNVAGGWPCGKLSFQAMSAASTRTSHLLLRFQPLSVPVACGPHTL